METIGGRSDRRSLGAADLLSHLVIAGRLRRLAQQQRVGSRLGNVGGVGTLDPADVGIVGIVVDIDIRREMTPPRP
jgi:hypothetical protein